MDKEIILFIVFLGLVQGVLLSLSIYKKRGLKSPNIFLVLLILAYCLVFIQKYLVTSGLGVRYIVWYYFTFATPLLFGPLFYFYLRSLIRGKLISLKHTYVHILPFLAVFSILLGRYFFLPEVQTLLYEKGLVPKYVTYLGAFKSVVFLLYTLLSLRELRSAPSNFQKLNPILFKWLTVFVWLTIVVWVIGIAAFVLGHFDIPMSRLIDDLPSLLLVIIIYVISYLAIRHPLILESKLKYQGSGVQDKALKEYFIKLNELMSDEKPFLDENLRLETLAKSLGINPNLLSRVINEYGERNFQEFINHHRVEEFKKALLNHKNAHKTILAIGLETGFNSKTVMNRVFKEHTGETPSQYQKKHKMY